MPELITLDIVDRPEGGVRRSMGRLRHVDPASVPGLRRVIRLRTQHFATSYWPSFTPRRIGALVVWDSDADIEAGRRLLFPAPAREHWHVRGEVTRAAFSGPWLGWQPETDGVRPLAGEEPALVFISGDLRARAFPAFTRDAIGAVDQANGHPGYLGGLGVMSSLLNTTSCSAWRTYADVRDYAFANGRHSEAMKRDRRDQRHVTEWFLRVRPLTSSGTLNGRDPFAGLLREPVAA